MSDINFATSTVERRQEYFKHSKHTNGFDFLTYRKKVMTAEEEELGQKIMDNYNNGIPRYILCSKICVTYPAYI